MSKEPGPIELSTVLAQMGRAGRRMEIIGACEAAAGNVSVFVRRGALRPDLPFSQMEQYALPCPAPSLAGGTLVITGSGVRLPDLLDNPLDNVGLLRISDEADTATLHTTENRYFDRLTCELNSHLGVHNDRIAGTSSVSTAIVHSQPLYMTFLSFIKKYQNETHLNRGLFSWQAECLVQIPEGIGYIPFYTPGSDELAAKNVEKFQKHNVVLWAKHGVMAFSDESVLHACDYIEYLETSARCEFMNLQISGLADGLLDEEIELVRDTFDLKTRMF